MTKKHGNAREHGKLSARARALKAAHPELGFAEIARRLDMTRQGVRNAITQRSRIGGKGLARAMVLTPNKLAPVGKRQKKAA